MHPLLPAGLALALAAPCAALAQTPPTTPNDIDALRREMNTLRQDYEARLRALEQRLQAAEARTAPAMAAAPAAGPSAATPPAATPAPAPAAPAVASANAFNPAVSLVLSGGYTHTQEDPESWRIAGFQLPADGELGPGERGFGLGETELTFSASVDPFWRGAVTLAVHEGVEVEEAFVQTTALGHGLSLKAGRFFSGIGYLNSKHAHAWDFIDNPLAYQAMLGTQYGDDGLQLRWIAPTDQYLEFGLELARGDGFPGAFGGRHGAGMVAATAHTGGDWGDSHSWQAGLSAMQVRADGLELLGTAADGSDLASSFSGRTRLWVADAVWKWAPGGNASRTSLTLQGEYLHSRRTGDLAPEGADAAAYASTQSGWYVQGLYQFLPGWRVGLRTERLDAGTPDYGANAGLYAVAGRDPSRHSLLLERATSEFARLRLQLAQDRSRDGVNDTQVMLQYQMSLGAHGAHGF